MPHRRHASPEKEGAVVIAAGARLETMRRRVRLSRVAVWTVIAAGPVALAVAVTSTPTATVAAPDNRAVDAQSVTAVAADPAGYAQVFMAAWLRSSADDTATAQARLAQSMAPDVELPDPASDAQPDPVSVTAVRSAHTGTGAGTWLVTVAAQYADGNVRYFAVPVITDTAGSSLAVTAAPAVVTGPGRAEPPESPYSVPVPEGELSSTVGEFLAAYLTGAGEVDRYMAPGVRLSAVSPAPFSAVTVPQISAIEQAAAGDAVPSDGSRVRIQATATAQDATGRWPLAYELTLTARSGRWEVAALTPTTAQGGGDRS
ncbi:conjugal transfer protein [Streptomyces justiciae]|uniref:conjugal transfer protein n=1 Tax=Streptomyces justiciae TaxID=2780140 RepID=UPI00211885DF|nr:conjugal transfer protein [Streptomyces justiciae]MCW8384100.1 conjugal transfer protein [Streptomyces justiciae]